MKKLIDVKQLVMGKISVKITAIVFGILCLSVSLATPAGFDQFGQRSRWCTSPGPGQHRF
jgi:hypothetical protein